MMLNKLAHWTNEVKVLYLCRNNRAQIVQEIAHICFPNLTELWLAENRIESVEGMEKMGMVQLKELFLATNRLQTVKVLRKAQWPLLSNLTLSNNFIKDMRTLTEAGFPRLSHLVLRLWVGMDANQFVDPCFPFKLETQSLCRLQIDSKKFSINRSIRRVLRKKTKIMKNDLLI